MHSDTSLMPSMESIDRDTHTLTSPMRFNDSGDLYCGWCLNVLRFVCHTKTGVSCADCGQGIDIAPQSFVHEDH